MRFFFQGCLIGAILITCCGPSTGKQTTVLAETERTNSSEKNAQKQTEATQGIADRIIEDKQLAAKVLTDSMILEDSALAAWAAVYVVRLGLKHDENQRTHALIRGALSPEDPLLSALCWRQLAAGHNVSKMPNWSEDKTADPVVQIMAAMTLARRGPLPKALKTALGLPKGSPSGPDRGVQSRRLVERLLAFCMPFDTGPLSLAVAFVEARRGEWIEQGADGKTDWVARRLRNELVKIVLGDDVKAAERIRASNVPGHEKSSTLLERLKTPLVSRPISMLRRAALAGPTDLRLEALRAIAVVATKPVAGDFGASAAALTSDDPRLRVEGARTFLLLFTRTYR